VHASNSIQDVAPFVKMTYRLKAKVKAGSYPGWPERLSEQYALFGGLFVFWVKRAIRAGLYGEALKLALSGWRMILTAVLHRMTLRMGGGALVQTMELHRTTPFVAETVDLAASRG
jgi:hypothetical protein